MKRLAEEDQASPGRYLKTSFPVIPCRCGNRPVAMDARKGNRCCHIASFKSKPVLGQCINVWSVYLFASQKTHNLSGLIVPQNKTMLGLSA